METKRTPRLWFERHENHHRSNGSVSLTKVKETMAKRNNGGVLEPVALTGVEIASRESSV